MKRIILFIGLILISSASADLDIGYEDINEDIPSVILEPELPSDVSQINYSIQNTNSSDYWDDLDTPNDIYNIKPFTKNQDLIIGNERDGNSVVFDGGGFVNNIEFSFLDEVEFRDPVTMNDTLIVRNNIIVYDDLKANDTYTDTLQSRNDVGIHIPTSVISWLKINESSGWLGSTFPATFSTLTAQWSVLGVFNFKGFMQETIYVGCETFGICSDSDIRILLLGNESELNNKNYTELVNHKGRFTIVDYKKDIQLISGAGNLFIGNDTHQTNITGANRIEADSFTILNTINLSYDPSVGITTLQSKLDIFDELLVDGYETLIRNGDSLIIGSAGNYKNISFDKSIFMPKANITANNIIIKNNLNVSGNITGSVFYAEVWMHNDTGTPISINTNYKNLTFVNTTNGTKLYGFDYSDTAGSIQALDNGLYHVSWYASGIGSQNEEYHGIIFINEIEQENTLGHTFGQSNSDVDMEGSGFIRVFIGDNITARLKNKGGAEVGTYKIGRINLHRIAN